LRVGQGIDVAGDPAQGSGLALAPGPGGLLRVLGVALGEALGHPVGTVLPLAESIAPSPITATAGSTAMLATAARMAFTAGG